MKPLSIPPLSYDKHPWAWVLVVLLTVVGPQVADSMAVLPRLDAIEARLAALEHATQTQTANQTRRDSGARDGYRIGAVGETDGSTTCEVPKSSDASSGGLADGRCGGYEEPRKLGRFETSGPGDACQGDGAGHDLDAGPERGVCGMTSLYAGSMGVVPKRGRSEAAERKTFLSLPATEVPESVKELVATVYACEVVRGYAGDGHVAFLVKLPPKEPEEEEEETTEAKMKASMGITETEVEGGMRLLFGELDRWGIPQSMAACELRQVDEAQANGVIEGVGRTSRFAWSASLVLVTAQATAGGAAPASMLAALDLAGT